MSLHFLSVCALSLTTIFNSIIFGEAQSDFELLWIAFNKWGSVDGWLGVSIVFKVVLQVQLPVILRQPLCCFLFCWSARTRAPGEWLCLGLHQKKQHDPRSAVQQSRDNNRSQSSLFRGNKVPFILHLWWSENVPKCFMFKINTLFELLWVVTASGVLIVIFRKWILSIQPTQG